MTQLQGVKVAILVSDLFEQVEMTSPRAALEAAGAQVTLVSGQAGQVRGMHHAEPGDTFTVEQALHDASAAHYDALVLPGGTFNADALRIEPQAQQLVRAFQVAEKPIGVICHGPWLLISAGLVTGRTLTSWPSLKDDVVNAGGHWLDKEVLREGNWVSSRKPDDLPAFNRELIQLISERRRH
ncbi:type 1 glutamine amidotransferase domain-containing protein [Chitiniphilus eburneus]|uniref:Type 1 glutamine amidotransferase n=1 Tax=Chitiniphilus eburneus TaxID=2571148 RepID=A0A4U0PWV0_9NEIS|nr:type 1 glutamine amidotransferase domain-containing protein [Chitiniphilus eburneus]TJZ72997.1 type 1 glutamine amidotransferase [Chitiniphilus eburneus]